MHIQKKWAWKMSWCKKQGLAPANSQVWKDAEAAYTREHK